MVCEWTKAWANGPLRGADQPGVNTRRKGAIQSAVFLRVLLPHKGFHFCGHAEGPSKSFSAFGDLECFFRGSAVAAVAKMSASDSKSDGQIPDSHPLRFEASLFLRGLFDRCLAANAVCLGIGQDWKAASLALDQVRVAWDVFLLRSKHTRFTWSRMVDLNI